MSARRKRAGRRGRRWWFLAVTLLIAAVAAYAALNPGGSRGSNAQEGAGPVTQPVDLQPHRVVVAGPGILGAARSVGVTPPPGVGGTVVSIRRVGERVEAGDELARRDPEPFERGRREARTATDTAGR